MAVRERLHTGGSSLSPRRSHCSMTSQNCHFGVIDLDVPPVTVAPVVYTPSQRLVAELLMLVLLYTRVADFPAMRLGLLTNIVAWFVVCGTR